MEHGEGTATYHNYVSVGPWSKGYKHGHASVTFGEQNQTTPIEWIWGRAKMHLKDGTAFVTGLIDKSTFLPIKGAKGMCKGPSDNQYWPCEVNDGKPQALDPAA